MKKLRSTIITLLITLVMVMSIFPTMAFAQSWYNNEEIDEIMMDEIMMDETNESTEENLPGYEETDPYLEEEDTIEDTTIEDITIEENPHLEEVAPEAVSLTIHFVDSYDNTKEIGNLVYDDLALEDSIDYSKDVSTEAEKYIEQNYYQMNDDSVVGIIGYGDFIPNESNNIDLYVNLEYRPYTVTFNYLEEGTENELRSQKVENIPFGDYDYRNTDAPEIKDYEFVEMAGDVQGTIEAIPGEKETTESVAQKSIVINVYYKKINNEKPAKDVKVIFNYYDELTSEKIDKSDVSYFSSLDSIKYDAPQFNGYKFHYAAKLIHDDGTVEVNLFYGRAEVSGKYRVKINYLEQGTDKVLSDQFISIKVPSGFKYDVSRRDALYISGYRHVKTVGDVKGIINDQDVVINVYYLKDGETAVNTGDYNKIMLWSGIGIVALALVVILGIKNKSMKK